MNKKSRCNHDDVTYYILLVGCSVVSLYTYMDNTITQVSNIRYPETIMDRRDVNQQKERSFPEGVDWNDESELPKN